MEHNEERQLISTAQQGDQGAFGKIYDKYIRQIYNFIYYKTYHKETAEDLTSITFTKAWQNIDKYKPEVGKFSSWLYQIARNSTIDHFRKFKLEENIEDIYDLKSDDNLREQLENKEQLEKVEQYLKNFTGAQREIIMLRIWEQMSYEEISAIVGKSEANCKMIFSRTIKKLRKEVPVAVLILLLMH